MKPHHSSPSLSTKAIDMRDHNNTEVRQKNGHLVRRGELISKWAQSGERLRRLLSWLAV